MKTEKEGWEEMEDEEEMKKDEDEKGRMIDGGNVGGGGGEDKEMWKGGDGRGDRSGEEGRDMRRRIEERRRS